MKVEQPIKVFVKNGDKEINIELDHVDEYQKLFLIHNVFSVFGIDTDLLESYKQVDKIYKLFYKEMEKDREYTKPVNQIDPVQIKQQMEDGYKEIAVGQEEVGLSSELQEEFPRKKGGVVSERLDSRAGIKHIDELPHYQLFYSCPNEICREKRIHKSKIYIPLNTEKTECQSCLEEMEVKPAHPEGFPKRDTFGNYFVAGYFRDHQLNWPNGKR